MGVILNSHCGNRDNTNARTEQGKFLFLCTRSTYSFFDMDVVVIEAMSKRCFVRGGVEGIMLKRFNVRLFLNRGFG